MPAAYAKDGFIHCSEAGQVEAVANAHFAGAASLLALEIDESLLPAPPRREDLYGLGEDYPHIYGPLPRGAVARAVPLLRGGDGRLRLPFGAVPGAASAAGLELGRSRPDEAEELARLRYEMFVDMHPEEDYSGIREALVAGCVDFNRRHAEDPDYLTFVVREGARLVGCAALMIEEKPPHARRLRNISGYVLSVYVDGAHRGRGIARALMERVKVEAAARGVARLSLHASVFGEPLYRSMGFAPNPSFLEMTL